jgi:hypothetical protein
MSYYSGEMELFTGGYVLQGTACNTNDILKMFKIIFNDEYWEIQ